MPFHKVTFNPRHRFATVHNYGCSHRCPICSYKLHSGPAGRPGLSFPRPDRFLSLGEIQSALRGVGLEQLFVMGGEPTLARDLTALLAWAKRELRVRTCLGHCNGWHIPHDNLDGANVGLKAWDPAIHRAYTGHSKDRIFGNFERAFRAGLELKANVVLIPTWVECDQIEAIARWIAALSPDIPFHIMGYIPVPGQPFPSPTTAQMDEAVQAARRHLRQVAASHLNGEQARDLTARDTRFAVERIA